MKSNLYKAAITGMEVGQTLDFPIEKSQTIRVTASSVGLALRRKYKTQSSIDRTRITVFRES